MDADEFDTAVRATEIRTPELIEAARLVLVAGSAKGTEGRLKPGEAANVINARRKAGRKPITTTEISRAVRTINEQWLAIVKANGLRWDSAALTENEWALVRMIKAGHLEKLREQLSGKPKRPRRKKS